jgi:phospholipid/cholesterol/gamma-HCH transport system substrate-binding protein
MEREANYVAVGAFMLLVTVMAGLFVYWYSDSHERRDYKRYEIYFDGSVSGLTQGGSVRYLGVDIGRVVRIRLDRRAADRVQVVVDIDSDAPISERTLAELSLQGVTGLLFIDLLQEGVSAQAQRLMDAVPGENYPVIRSIRSNFDVFLSSLPEVASRMGEVAARANRLLSDENIQAFTRLAANLERAGSTLPQATRDAGVLIAELRATITETRALITQVRSAADTAAPDLAAAIARLRTTSDHLAVAAEQLEGLMKENRGEVRGFVHDALPEIEALVRDTRAATSEFRQLTRGLRENPSQLIYQAPATGVEIPR